MAVGREDGLGVRRNSQWHVGAEHWARERGALGEKDRLAARQEHESRVVEPRDAQGALAHLQSHCPGPAHYHFPGHARLRHRLELGRPRQDLDAG